MRNIKNKPASRRTLAIAALLFVALGYSLLSVGSRLINEGLTPMTGLYTRVGIAAIVAWFIFRKHIRVQKLRTIPKRDWLPLILMSTLGYTVSVYFITLAALTTKLLNVTVVFATLPFFALLYSWMFLKTKLKPLIIPLLLLSLYGVMVVATRSFTPALPTFGMGELFAILATATAAWYGVGRKMLSPHLNIQEITVLTMAIASLGALILAVATGETFQFSALTRWEVWLGLTIGVGFNIISSFFETFAFDHLDATFATQLLLMDNVFSALLGFFIYAELFTHIEVLGGLIIVGSVFLTNKLLSDA